MYVGRHPRRDEITEALKRHDICLNISYPWPVHTMTGFQHLGYPTGYLPVTGHRSPVTERLAGEIFSLPMVPSLPLDTQDRVIGALREALTAL